MYKRQEVKSFTTLSIPITGVSLDKTSITLKVGETSKLNATVLPANEMCIRDSYNCIWKNGKENCKSL